MMYTFRVVKIKKLAMPVLIILFLLCLIFLSKTAVSSALKGLELWWNIVFPSLFPFFVASELLNGTGFTRALGVLMEPVMRPLFNVPGCGSFAFLMGITSGYPVGAKITAGLRKEGLLTSDEAGRLLAFSNNSGPLFVIGAVATGMFKMPKAGIFLLLCHIAACITVGLLFGLPFRRQKSFQGNIKEDRFKEGRFKNNRFEADSFNKDRFKEDRFKEFKQELSKKPKGKPANLGAALGDAVGNSMMTLLSIGGFIILFSVLIHFLLETGAVRMAAGLISLFLKPLGVKQSIVTAAVCGFFEITTGANLAAAAQGASLPVKLAAASFIIGWAGLSVHSQVMSIVGDAGISVKPYLLGKFLQGIISSVFTVIGIKTAGHLFLDPEPVFALQEKGGFLNWHSSMLFSVQSLLAFIFLLFAAFFILHWVRRFCRIFRGIRIKRSQS